MIRTMKKSILVAVVLVAAMFSVNAQSYVNISVGPSFAAGKGALTDLGSNAAGLKAEEGSYDAGFKAYARYGYYVMENLAVELGVSYTNGNDLDVLKAQALGGAQTKASAISTSYGGALTAKYDLGGMYVRGGLTTKLSGSTVSKQNVTTKLPNGADLVLDNERESSGRFSLGYTAGLGYQYNLSDNLGIFVEGVYDGLNVKGKESVLKGSNISLAGQTIDLATLKSQLGGLPAAQAALYNSILNSLYEEKRDTKNNDASPYSSWGIQVGASFRF